MDGARYYCPRFSALCRNDESEPCHEPEELYHNQVTRRKALLDPPFHRSWGILMIQENIKRPARCSISTRETSPASCERVAMTSGHLLDVVNVASAGNVRLAREISPVRHCGGRPRGCHSGNRESGRRRPHRQGRRHAWCECTWARCKAPIRHPALDSGFDCE